jgi:WD40 repeat protein
VTNPPPSAKVFDVATKTQLRTLHGHTTATRKVDFTTDGTHVVTFSDDKTVGLWDLAAETRLQTFGEHGDYVRAGCVSSVNSDLIVSGKLNFSSCQPVRLVQRLQLNLFILWPSPVPLDPYRCFVKLDPDPILNFF